MSFSSQGSYAVTSQKIDLPSNVYGSWSAEIVSDNPAVLVESDKKNNTLSNGVQLFSKPTSDAGVCLFDLPAALEDESVRRGGASINELMVAARWFRKR